MKKAVLLILCFGSLLNSFSQQPKPEVKYFSAREYGKAHEATNWACVQDKYGLLYFGNAGGIIQYDGVNWSYIPVSRQQSVWVKALAVSDENVIYVGAQNEFGYLAPDATGKLSYISLSDKLEEDQKSFSSIIRVWAWNKQVAFQSENGIFIYSGNNLKLLEPETSFHLSFLVDGELYVRQREIGIMKLAGDSLEFLKGSDFFKDFGIFSILRSSDPLKLIIITREDGFWLADKNSLQAEPIISPDNDLLKKSGIYGAIKLSDGSILLNTLSDGIFITDEHFRILSHINKDNGLKVNGVLAALQDYQGDIWAGLDNGIAQVWYYSPVSEYGPESGISGNINSILRFGGRLFIGTTDGLFVENQETGQLAKAFIPFPGLSKEIRNLCIADETLLAATQDGLYQLEKTTFKMVDEGIISAIYYSENLRTLFVAGKDRVRLFQHSGEWKRTIEIPDVPEGIVSIEEEESPETAVWICTALGGVVRLKFSGNTVKKIDKYQSADDGLVSNSWVLPFKINGKLVFSQQSGLLEFIDEEVLKQQLPDSLRERPEFSRGYFDNFVLDSLQEPLGTIYVALDTRNRIYANREGELGYFDKMDSLHWVTKPFRLTDVGKVNVFYHENNGICWIGGDDGLIRFDENVPKNYDINFRSLLVRVTCTGDSLLNDGYTSGNIAGSATLPVLKYKSNTVSFHFAAPFFEGQDKTLYSCQLAGQDKNFGPWEPENKVVFSNLPEGNYTFKLRAKNAYGHLSSESTFSFVIMPPWYRTIWAILLYIAGFVVFVYAGIRINSHRLIEKNKKLEEIIQDRTQEIKRKNIVLEHQKQEILDSINYALRIQKAVLPDDELTNLWLGDHFILFRPKDIVSGDFYWATQLDNKLFFCVADCTGHGVPGAFMSMLCISFLNEVVLKDKISDSGEIFNRLREMIIESLKQKGVSGEQKDGMDITLCIINKETMELQFSGANNPLYILRSKDQEEMESDKKLEGSDRVLYEFKGDSMPIAIHVKMDPFRSRKVKLCKDDRLYIFSDGIADQFGGPSTQGGGKKFMYKTFKTVLLETGTSGMEAQKSLVEEKINEWMAYPNPDNGLPYEQVDDICLMGVRI